MSRKHITVFSHEARAAARGMVFGLVIGFLLAAILFSMAVA